MQKKQSSLLGSVGKTKTYGWHLTVEIVMEEEEKEKEEKEEKEEEEEKEEKEEKEKEEKEEGDSLTHLGCWALLPKNWNKRCKGQN